VQLRDAAVEGRLTLEEFSERVSLAQRARTQQELAGLTRDVPDVYQSSLPVPAEATYRAVCSHLVRRGAWELSPRSRFSSIFGTIDLDLRQARLAAAEVDMHIRNVFGTVTVVVPEGVAVSVTGGGLFASQIIDPPARPAAPDAPRLHIRLSGPGGTLRVRSCAPDRTRLARWREPGPE
jgi:hypothetical protein